MILWGAICVKIQYLYKRVIVTKFRFSIRTRVVRNRAPSRRQKAVKRQGKDLATRGAARGLVSLSTFRPTLAR